MNQEKKTYQELESRIKELEAQNRILNAAIQEKDNKITDKLKLSLLHESEQRFKELFNNVPVAYQSLDINGFIIDVNNFWLKLLGYEADEVMGKLFGDFWSEDSAKHFPSVYQGFKDACWINNAELKLRKKDGTIIDAFLTGRIQEKSKGEFGKTHCIIYDISELKTLQRNLKQSETFLLQSQSVAHTGSYKLDIATGMWESSKTLDEIFGLDEKDERTVDSWNSIIFHEDRENMINYFIKEVMEGQNDFNKEYRIVNKKTNNIHWVHGRGKLNFSPQKQLISMIGTIQDISDRVLIQRQLKESEERFSLALRGSKDGLWDWNISTNEIYYSPQYKKMLGYEDHEFNNTFKSLEKIIHPEDLNLLHQHFKEYQESRTPDFKIEYRLKHKNGKWLSILSRAVKESDNFGKVKRLIGTHVDITQIRNIEQQLRASNATKDKFFSIIAHDLKSPFNSIIGFSNLLVEQIKKEDYNRIERYVNIIHQSSEKAMDLLSNLLDWSLTQTGRMEYAPAYIELVSIINEVVALSKGPAEQKSIRLSTKLPHNIPVFADKEMINAIVRNLVSNAIKFTNPEGHVLITSDQLQEELKISVIDNGVGIDDTSIEKLFHIDENYSTPGAQDETGTGLGLILCKEFIEKHRGKIWAESQINKGSKFHFTIPEKKS